jgi:hypothetical protein
MTTGAEIKAAIGTHGVCTCPAPFPLLPVAPSLGYRHLAGCDKDLGTLLAAIPDDAVLVTEEQLAEALGPHPQDPEMRRQRAAAIFRHLRGEQP